MLKFFNTTVHCLKNATKANCHFIVISIFISSILRPKFLVNIAPGNEGLNLSFSRFNQMF